MAKWIMQWTFNGSGSFDKSSGQLCFRANKIAHTVYEKTNWFRDEEAD
ncbi:MAG: hypothetical protein ICV79_09470 [Flavisolibacter sp.]|nr:hypothetical protein [Flavisolibacter sp.]